MSNTGYLTREDFFQGLVELGIRADPDHIEDIWDTILYNDETGDGQISLEEFYNFAIWRTAKLRESFDKVCALVLSFVDCGYCVLTSTISIGEQNKMWVSLSLSLPLSLPMRVSQSLPIPTAQQ